ncbi:MAG: peptidyl-prolyl cis-trans isomerase [Deltaproteobacteria bacterium]|nr:peptidyl-prolyl cis-trans isomerase [Deltaproteobacteria bacterium]
MLFDSAQSAGLDKDPEVLRGLADAKKGLMVTKLIEQRSGDKVRVDDVDIKNYYEAHKDKLKDKDGKVLPFEKVKDQLARSLAAEKQSAVVQEMISELGTSRGVEIFDDRL